MASPSVPPGLDLTPLQESLKTQERRPFADIGPERRCSLIEPESLEGYKVLKTFLKKRFSIVELVKLASGKNVVLKTQVLDYEDGIFGNEIGEVDNLVRLRGAPNIVQLEGACFKENRMMIVAEPLSGSLRDLTKMMSSTDRLINVPNLMYSMIYVLALFEAADIYHFDIKPLNILYNYKFNKHLPVDRMLTPDDRYIFKMSDFGGARTQASLADMSQITLTLGYIPPEIIVKRPADQFDPHESDLWSLGITVLEFIIGHHVYTIPHDIKDHKAQQLEYLNQMYQHSTVITNPDTRGYIAPGDFRRVNREGLLINESLDVERILSEHLYSEQKVDPTVVKILKELLKLNPTSRRSARQLLSLYYGQQVDNAIIDNLIPGEFPRRVSPEGIQLIRDLVEEKREYDEDLTDVPMLVAIELYTRFLGLLSQDDFNRLTKEDLLESAVAALRLALKYVHEDFNMDLSDVDFGVPKYSSEHEKESEEEESFAEESSDEELGIDERILNYEKIILLTVDFLVYNLNLSTNIEGIKYISFDVDPQEYLKPLNTWFDE